MMPTQDLNQWVERVHIQVRRFNLVFVHVGIYNEPARRALSQSSSNVLMVDDYLDSKKHQSDTILLSDLEVLAGARGSRLGPLRERIFAEIDRDVSVIMLSRSPRAAFPSVPGSSVLADATLVSPPPWQGEDYSYWPTCIADSANKTEILESSLEELGPEVCAAIDRVVFEGGHQGEDALKQFNTSELEAFRGAGLAACIEGVWQWHFPRHLAPLKSALATALSNIVDSQQSLQEINAGLWKIERTIRRSVRRQAISEFGTNWRKPLFNQHLTRQILERATTSAYYGSTSLSQIRDPLEWLSLGELLQLKDLPQIGNLGVTSTIWGKFTSEIMPIRNRLAHMRTLHPSDRTHVARWQRILETRLD